MYFVWIEASSPGVIFTSPKDGVGWTEAPGHFPVTRFETGIIVVVERVPPPYYGKALTSQRESVRRKGRKAQG